MANDNHDRPETLPKSSMTVEVLKMLDTMEEGLKALREYIQLNRYYIDTEAALPPHVNVDIKPCIYGHNHTGHMHKWGNTDNWFWCDGLYKPFKNVQVQ